MYLLVKRSEEPLRCFDGSENVNKGLRVKSLLTDIVNFVNQTWVDLFDEWVECNCSFLVTWNIYARKASILWLVASHIKDMQSLGVAKDPFTIRNLFPRMNSDLSPGARIDKTDPFDISICSFEFPFIAFDRYSETHWISFIFRKFDPVLASKMIGPFHPAEAIPSIITRINSLGRIVALLEMLSDHTVVWSLVVRQRAHWIRAEESELSLINSRIFTISF